MAILIPGCKEDASLTEPGVRLNPIAASKAVKVPIYHTNGQGVYTLMEVEQNAVAGHLGHGDQLATVVVRAGDLATGFTDPNLLSKWFFYNDETDQIDNSLGSFVAGPGTPPAGTGSIQISVAGTQRRNIGTYQFSGTPLANITTFTYSTYNPSAGNGGSPFDAGFLVLNVDFDGSDTWQCRLVYVPRFNGAVIQNLWQEWNVISPGALWVYSGATWPGGVPGTTPKTWAQILTEYPGVRIRVTDSFVGVRVGDPSPLGYTENIDAFRFGTASYTQTFDFEN